MSYSDRHGVPGRFLVFYLSSWVGQERDGTPAMSYRARVLDFDDLTKAKKTLKTMQDHEANDTLYKTRQVRRVTANFEGVNIGVIERLHESFESMKNTGVPAFSEGNQGYVAGYTAAIRDVARGDFNA